MEDHTGRETKIERVVAAAALLVFLASSYLVWDESLFNSLFAEKTNGKPIAKVTSSRNDVRRRNTEQMAWYSMNRDSEVYQEDLIFAGNNSEAMVEFKDGNKLKIDPNTLITLKESETGIELDLKYGAFKGQIDKGKTLQVIVDGKKQVIKGSNGSEIVIKKGNTGAQIEVLSGQVKVDDKKIAKRQKVKLKPSGEVTLPVGIDLALLAPKYGTRIWKRKDIPVIFKWTQMSRREYQLLVSTDSSFKNIIATKKVSQNESTQLQLPETGIFYWKVITTKGLPVKTSPTWNLSFNVETAPTLTYPPPLAKFQIKAERADESQGYVWKEKKLTFSFTHQPEEKHYLLQISDTEDFSSNIIQKRVTGLRTDDVSLPHGEYFWRVKVDGSSSDTPRTQTLWSATGEFHILNAEQFLEQPELLLSQSLDYQIPVLRHESGLYTSSAEAISSFLLQELPRKNLKTPRLSYSQVFAAEAYEFEIISTRRSSRRLVTKSSPTLIFPTLIPGNYNIRLRAKNRNTKPSPWTAKRRINIFVAPPASTVEESYEGPAGNTPDSSPVVELKWTPRVFARSYEIRLSTEENFANSSSYFRTSTSLPVKISANTTYYWKVRALGENRQTISRFSSTSRLYYNQFLPPPAPVLAEIEEIPEVEIEEVEINYSPRPKSDLAGADLGAEGLLARSRAPRFFSWEVERRDPSRKPNYWVKGGTGANYQSISQTTGSQTINIDQLGGPTAYINLGAASDVWGADMSFKTRSVNLQSSSNLTVSPASFSWQTFALEGLYAFKTLMNFFGLKTESRIRAGVQRNNLPLVADNGTTALDVATASIDALSVGADFTLGRKNRLRYELLMRYQYAFSGSTDLGDSFTITPGFAFDGSIGLVYRLTPTSYFGLHWGAQLQNYSFSGQNSGTNADGDQSLFFSNIDTQLGFEF